MKHSEFSTRRKVGRAKPRPPAIKLVNLSHLALVLDPHCRRGDRDEQAPPCPLCRSAASTLWFRDRRTAIPELVCLDCTRYEPTVGEFPKREAPLGAAAR